MKSSVSANFVAAGFVVAGLASIYGCSSDTSGGNTPTFPIAGSANNNTAGNSTGTGGSGATSGSDGTSGAGMTAGSPAMGGSGNMAGAGMGGNGTSGAGTAGAGMSGAGGGSGGGGNTNVITKVWKSDACGKAYGGAAGQKITIGTTGTKAPDCQAKMPNGDKRCGPWGQESSTWQKPPLPRDYWVYMPTGYDMNKAYPLVFEGPGCGGNGGGVYDLPDAAKNVIRIGISPANKDIVGHGTNPGQGCFDDKEGDDSLDWVFYEALYDKLNSELCFDRNRVFTVGDSSGSWFSNELGCKYAGDAKRPVRGIMPNTGGLPVEPQFSPTCTKAPMAGMWIHEVGDKENFFSGNKFAINRAMTVNGCMGATDYDDAEKKNLFEDFAVPGSAAGTCKKIKGCPDTYPLVVCALPGTQHAPHTNIADPGFSKFINMFSTGSLLTQ